MAWFNFLKEEGYFDPEKNPEPIEVKEGIQVPHWEALTYLEKLSLQIKEGNELELVEKLVAVIKNVSEHPKDNYRTWYWFLKILSNLPKEKITIEILHFIPTWLSGRFDTMLQTSELCEKLLPKFLNDNPTVEDIEKAELILHYLFQVEKPEINQTNIWNYINSYHSRTYLHSLSERFERGGITPKVARYCSSNLLLQLGRTIKFLLLNYPNGIQTKIKTEESEYIIRIDVEKENLIISAKLDNGELTKTTSIINQFEELSKDELRTQLISKLKEQGINYIPQNDYDDTFQRLNHALNINDLSSLYGLTSIKKLDDIYSNNEKVLNVFSLVFRDILDEKAKQNPQEAISLLKTFCYDKKYYVPFYKRVTLYVISENWRDTNSLFWDLIKDNDSLYLFSKYQYQKELFELLEKNQQFLTSEQKSIIQNIINRGEQDKKDEKESDDKYWQLRWYSALKDIEPFKEKYLELSKSLDITHEHFENSGEIKWRRGSISPIATEDILKKSNSEIASFIKSFKPKDRWEDPNIDGLSEAIANAIETEPQKFADEIDEYQEIPYIYSHRILNAFGEAWKKQKTFNWDTVLEYCLSMLKNEKFYSGQLKLESDSWGARADWVVGSISNLLTYGMQNDNNAFDIKLLPQAKEIIQIIIPNLKPVEDFKGTNMDYPTYSLNSTAGKSLRALLDYSLRRARHLFKYDDVGKWEPEIQLLFEDTLEKGILDGHILQGMYFEQFYFLDKEWITSQVRNHYNSGDREWLAFMGGIAFGRAPFNKDLYTLFYPHYERAIENNIQFKGHHNNGLVRHLTTFYFWGFETLSSEKLLFKFVNKSTPDGIKDLISFIWQQEKYLNSLTELEQDKLRQLILELWTYLASKYEHSPEEKEQEVLASLIHWVAFIPELNETYTKLILKSCKQVDKNYLTHELLKNILILKNKGNPTLTASLVSEIVSAIPFNEYIHDSDQKVIIELVSFLFENGESDSAIKFCNNMAVNQQFFLRETYEKFVSINK